VTDIQSNPPRASSDERISLIESAVLKEYEALRAQILYHLEATNNLSTTTITLTGAILAGFAFLQSSLLALDHHIQILGLIVLSLVFTAALFTGVSHDRDMSLIAEYIYARIRPSLAESLKVDVDASGILDWDVYHQDVRFKGVDLLVESALVGHLAIEEG
jgi:hypothetical protein